MKEARRITDKPLLVRLDGGNGSIENIDIILEHTQNQNKAETAIDFIIQLYADHGTSEQFHSEFKTDLDIVQMPSGKFATNALVLAMSALTYSILRWIGQNGLIKPSSTRRHKAKRRRIKTVMQELMYLAARVCKTSRYIKLAFGKGCKVFDVMDNLYPRLAYG